MRARNQAIAWLLMGMGGGLCHAAAGPVGCPATVTVSQQLSTPVAGWKAGTDDLPHRLSSITFFDGPPEENASLVNDSTIRGAGKEIALWRFGTGGSRTIWMTCGYSGTSITLSKSLPVGISSCSVTYNPRQQVAGLPLIEQINCR